MPTHAVLVLALLAACRPDAPPARTEPVRAASKPRQAKLPVVTRSNVIRVTTQLRAESAWSYAEIADTVEAWDAAADLFAQAGEECTSDCGEVAYAAVLARSNAIQRDPSLKRDGEKPTEPQPIPERVESFVAAADAYIEAAPDDDSAAGVAFLAGKAFDDYGWLEESVARYGVLIEGNPANEVSEYSANLLLDAFNRRERYDELLQFARMFAANASLMAAHPDLAETVRDILASAAR